MGWRPTALRSLTVARHFLPDVRAHAGQLALVGALSVGVTLLELAKPWPLQWIVDHALVPADGSGADPVTVVTLGALASLVFAVGAAGAQYVRQVRLAGVSHQVTRALRHRIFAHLASLSPRFHQQHKTGDLLVRMMGDAPLLQAMLVESAVELATRALLVLGTLVVMLSLDPLLALAVLACLPLLVLIVRLSSRRIHAAVGRQRRKEGDMADLLHEAVAGAAVLQSLGREQDTVQRFARSNRTTARAGLKGARLSAGLGLRVEAMLGTTLAAALGFGAWRVLQGHLSAGELLVFMSYVRGLLKPVRAASRHGERVAKGTACGERILEVLDSGVEVSSAPGAPGAPDRPTELAFVDVRFSYEQGRPALDGFSARFHRGEVVGVFGDSGAGKSTFAALAQRLYDPDAGHVRVDGVDLRELDLASLRSRYGLCLQDAVLFGDTVRENLLLGEPEAKDEALWDALSAAGADDVVAALPGGLDAQLGAAGAGLSGGQRRRLSLARTLLRHPPILVVDEPFAGLDAAAVDQVRNTLVSQAKDGIVIVITHDREHLEVFDRVVWVADGRVKADGPHAALLERYPEYRAAAGPSPRPAVAVASAGGVAGRTA